MGWRLSPGPLNEESVKVLVRGAWAIKNEQMIISLHWHRGWGIPPKTWDDTFHHFFLGAGNSPKKQKNLNNTTN